jgi:hypothetical protein
MAMPIDLSNALLSHKSENQDSDPDSNNNHIDITPTNMTSRNEEETRRGGLNSLNYLNIGSYLLNFIVTYGVGTLGWLGNGNNAVLSEKYQVSCVRSAG